MRFQLCMSGRCLRAAAGATISSLLYSDRWGSRRNARKGRHVVRGAKCKAGRESSTLEMCRRLVPPSPSWRDLLHARYEVIWKIRGR